MSDAAYEVKLTLEITKDGHKFAKSGVEYGNMDYANMQLVQGTVIRALLALGDAKLEAK